MTGAGRGTRRTGLAPLLALLLAAAILGLAGAARAQTAAEGEPDAPPELTEEALSSPEAVRSMVARLSDEDVRAILLQRLEAAAAKPPPDEETPVRGLGEIVESLLFGPFVSAYDAASKAPQVLTKEAEAVSTFMDRRGAEGVLRWIALVVAAVAAGLAAEWVAELFARSWRGRIREMAHPDAVLAEKLKALGLRLMLDLIKLAAFYFVTRAILVAFVSPEDAPLTRTVVISVVLMPMIVAAATRFILAPHQPHLRLVNTDDATAKRLQRNIFGIATLIGFTLALLTFNRLNGVQPTDIRLGFWFNLAIFVWIGAVIWRSRDGLMLMMRGFDEDLTPMEGRVAWAYPRFAMAALIGCWLVGEALVAAGLWYLIDDAEHLITLAILLAAPALDTLTRALVNSLAPAMTGEGLQAEAAHRAALRSYLRIGRVVALGLVLAAIAKVWGVDPATLLSGEVRSPVASGLFRFASVLIVGYLLLEVAALWFNSRIAAERTAAGIDLADEEPGGGEGGGMGSSRMSTVLPLISWFLQAAIVVLTVLVALSNLGIDVTPLLAGAGIVGLAIGFGAQKLVSDVVSGLFFLIDDAFRVGEYVEVDGTVGTVEKISVRSLQLRHHRGPVHTIPYGEIPKITNYSRDWVIMKLKFTVPFETDLAKVKRLFKQIGKEMIEIPEYAPDFLQPFKSQGVLDVNDVGIVVRGKFMAKPGRQFVLRREIYARVQKAFEEAGIQFARREVRVKVDGSHEAELSEEEMMAAAAQGSDERPA